MRLSLCTGFALALLLPLTPAASAAVEVSFLAPESYVDAGRFPRERAKPEAGALRELAQHLHRLGETYLPAGRSLRIEVLDVDLAGRFEPWRPIGHDVRVLREATWPKVALRYVLEQDGRELSRGEETVADRSYLGRPTIGGGSDPLRHEKVMLEDWFRARFAAGEARAG